MLTIWLLTMHLSGSPETLLFKHRAYQDIHACQYQAKVMRGVIESGAKFDCEKVEVR